MATVWLPFDIKSKQISSKIFWRTQQDSNLQSSPSEGDVLSSCTMGTYRRYIIIKFNKNQSVRLFFVSDVISCCVCLSCFSFDSFSNSCLNQSRFGIQLTGIKGSQRPNNSYWSASHTSKAPFNK